MTTGIDRAIAPLLALIAAAAACMAPAAAADWGVEQLMASLAQVRSSTARFTERRHVAILDAPLESSGTLVYVAPARLEKHTAAPQEESLVLDGNRLTIESKARNERRTFALDQQPDIRAFVEGMRSTLAGDLATLHRYYEVGLEGSERRWRLTLKPREPRMRDLVGEVRISGSRNRIGRIEIIETTSDRSVMTIIGDGA